MDIQQSNAIRDTAAILAKVQALLSKTVENGCTEQEASAAAAKVQSLLAAHNLNLAALDNASTPVYETRERTETNTSAMFHYQRKLMECLASNNFCMSFLVGSGKERKSYQLIGRKINVLSTIQTYQYLMQAMARLNPFSERKDAMRWNEGCTDRLVERLNERRREQENESQNAADSQRQANAGTGTDLVVLADVYGSEEELNADARDGLAPGTHAARRRKCAAEHAAWMEQQRQYDAKRNELVRAGMEPSSAWYAARGLAVPVRHEPTEQERKRQEREDRARNERYEKRWAREDAKRDREHQREQARLLNHAYQAGRIHADEIGLDQQVSKTDRGLLN
jgi:hypothetical protein